MGSDFSLKYHVFPEGACIPFSLRTLVSLFPEGYFVPFSLRELVSPFPFP